MPEQAPAAAVREIHSLRELTPQQWKAGIAAWLGWLFDGLDMHLYTLIAAPFVAQLLLNTGAIESLNPAAALVKEKSSWIQAAFLVGWALGGGVFGRLGDRLGRSRALSLTILTYAVFTGLSFFAQTWWHLLICRFLAALGIGGEWAVGSALLSETWPKSWRPWIAATLQSGVNIGVLLACLTVFALAAITSALGLAYQPRWVFLVGILPALLVFWIRRKVPEPETWHQAKLDARGAEPGIADLFASGIRRLTLLTMVVCACSLTAWWAFMFWHAQHLRNLPELASWPVQQREKLISAAFFLVIGVSIFGNFFCGWLARRVGYRRAIALMCGAFFVAMTGTFAWPRTYAELAWFWFPLVGFCSSVFSIFTMYLPPLFPVLLRTTGAGFCYNIGRIAAAAGTVVFGLFAPVGDFRHALLYAGCLFPIAMAVALLLPEPPDEAGPSPEPLD
jgi:MFS family permease